MSNVGRAAKHFADLQRRGVVPGARDQLVESKVQESYDAVVYAFGSQADAERALSKVKGAFARGGADDMAGADYSGRVLKRGDAELSRVKGAMGGDGEFFVYFRASPEVENIVRQSVETDPSIKLIKQDPKFALIASKKQTAANLKEDKRITVESLHADPAAFIKSLTPRQRMRLSEAVTAAAGRHPTFKTEAEKLVRALA